MYKSLARAIWPVAAIAVIIFGILIGWRAASIGQWNSVIAIAVTVIVMIALLAYAARPSGEE